MCVIRPLVSTACSCCTFSTWFYECASRTLTHSLTQTLRNTGSDVAPVIVLPSSLFQASKRPRAMQPTSEPLHAFARATLCT